MIIRKIDFEKDYEVISEWWSEYLYSILPKDFFPENTFVAIQNESLVGIVMMYLTDSPMMLIEHLTVSPEVKSPKRKLIVIRSLVDYAMLQAKIMGFKIGMAHTRINGMRKVLNKKGYSVSKPEYSLIYGAI